MSNDREAKVKITLDTGEAKKIVEGIEAQIKKLQMASSAAQSQTGTLSPTLAQNQAKQWYGQMGMASQFGGGPGVPTIATPAWAMNMGPTRQQQAANAAGAPAAVPPTPGQGFQHNWQGNVNPIYNPNSGAYNRLKASFGSFNPVNVGLAAIETIPVGGPVVAGGARFAIENSEYGPLLAGVMKGAGIPGGKALEDASVSWGNAAIQIKTFGRAFAPALDMMLALARAQAITGQVGVDKLPEIAKQAYDINYAQISLEQKIRQQSMKLVGEGIGSGLADFVRQRMVR